MRLYSFDTAQQRPDDFEYAHWWCQTHPDSTFIHGLWIYRHLRDGGWITLAPDENPGRRKTDRWPLVLIRSDGRGKNEQTVLHDEAALAKALADGFGIVEGTTGL